MANRRKYKDKATAKKAQARYANIYNKVHYKGFTIRFMIEQDKDIIDYVSKQTDKIGFFRKCLTEYMNNHKGE